MVAESSSTELACSVAPWARAWAVLDTCSAPADTCSALSRIWLMVSLSLDWMLSRETLMDIKSPTYSCRAEAVKSPEAMESNMEAISPM